MFSLTTTQQLSVTKAMSIIDRLHGVYLACEMRTGKTPMSLTTASKYTKKACVVTKAKNVKEKSFEKCVLDFGIDIKIDVFSWDSLHKITEKYDVYILDEAHNLNSFIMKNRKSPKRYRLLKAIVGNSIVIWLSGTPFPEKTKTGAYHLFNISNYSPFASYKNFYVWANVFVDKDKSLQRIGEEFKQTYKVSKDDLIDKFIDPYFIYLTQEEAGVDNNYDENILYVNMKPITYSFIKTLNKEKILRFDNDLVALADTAGKKMSKTHQLCSGTILDELDNIHIIDDSKARFIKLRFAEHKKVVIFYKYRGERELLNSVLGVDNIETSYHDYKINDKKYFVSQFLSGREGLDLSIADHIVFMAIDYAFLSYQQTKARIQNINKTGKNTLWFIFAKKGIEKNILDAVLEKKDYNANLFSKDYKQLLKEEL